jgi:DNA polymerase-4
MLAACSPLVEQASVDEAYVDLTGTETVHGSPVRMAALLKADIRAATGLTCSIGIAPVKFLAKIASDHRKPDGLTFIDAEDVPAFLARLPVGKIPGVGEKTARSLGSLGILVAADILKFPRTYWEERFGKFGLFLHDRAQGVDPSEIVPWSEPKSCSAENTFQADVDDPEELRKWLLHQAERVGRELREDGYLGRTVVLKLKFADFTQITRSRTLPEPTNLTGVIFEEGARLLEAVRLSGKVRLIGVGMSGLTRGTRQLPLCPDGQVERQALLEQTLDEVRRKFGDAALTRGLLFGFNKK